MKGKDGVIHKTQKFIVNKVSALREVIADDGKRRPMLFKAFNVMLAIVAAFMTVVNIFSAKWLLMWFTLGFTVACTVNFIISYFGNVCRRIASVLFLIEAVVLCTAFCITGTPEGFSALWICFIPSFSFALIGLRWGCAYSLAGFLIIAFLFWTPIGRSWLQYDYTQSFMLRFPMIYAAFFLVGMFLEFVRAETQSKLKYSERRYQFLYKHDSLTEILNRYGFNEKLNEIYDSADSETVTLMILDLDNFKRINDEYGHGTGDVILRSIAHKICFLGGDNAVVSRWGGEEFTLLCRNIENPEKLAEDIRRYIGESIITVGDYNINVTVSIGVCTVSDRKNITVAAFVQAADRCLYRAKAAGRNKVDHIILSDGDPAVEEIVNAE